MSVLGTVPLPFRAFFLLEELIEFSGVFAVGDGEFLCLLIR